MCVCVHMYDSLTHTHTHKQDSSSLVLRSPQVPYLQLSTGTDREHL